MATMSANLDAGSSSTNYYVQDGDHMLCDMTETSSDLIMEVYVQT